jgi:hypothetical protein
MGLVGKLADFPLPEILLLIGTRTGRLQLFEVPDFDTMELELSEGCAHSLCLGDVCLDEDKEIVTQLSLVVSKGAGNFQFYPEPDIHIRREHPLPINNLVILMVMYVDEVLTRRGDPTGQEALYTLQVPEPDSDIDPNLGAFLTDCRQLLIEGVSAEDIAVLHGLKTEDVRLNLAYLRQLGFVQFLDNAAAMKEMNLDRNLTQTSAQLQFASQASQLIRSSGKLFKIGSR